MPAGMTNGEINRLGKRLREVDTVSPDDLTLLQQLREAHDDALAEVARILRDELGVEPTTRLKTVNTLVDKVRREHMKLAEVQDIAGARITLANQDTRTQQDEVVARLETRFPGGKVVDRRLKPTFGYRAVHLVIRMLDCRVEIQVRTRLQNVWAQTVENLGDAWGRQIRYGAQPGSPDRSGPNGVTRREAWEDLLALSEVYDEVEQRVVAVVTIGERLESIRIQVGQHPAEPAVAADQRTELATLASELDALDQRGRELQRQAEYLTGRVADALAADAPSSRD